MSITKHGVELSGNEWAQWQIQGKLIFDEIRKECLTLLVVGEQMQMSPGLKRTLFLNIYELAPLQKLAMGRHPGHLKRSRSDLEMTNVSLFNADVVLSHFARLPGWVEPTERSGVTVVMIEIES